MGRTRAVARVGRAFHAQALSRHSGRVPGILVRNSLARRMRILLRIFLLVLRRIFLLLIVFASSLDTAAPPCRGLG
jgi:hypothetical protein